MIIIGEKMRILLTSRFYPTWMGNLKKYEFFIEFTVFLKITFNLPYRQLQGVLRRLPTYILGEISRLYYILEKD